MDWPTSARCSGPSAVSSARTVVRGALGQDHDLVADAERPAVHHPGIGPSTSGLAQHPLHREAGTTAVTEAVLGGPAPGAGRLQGVEHGGPVVPGGGVGTLHHVVAVERRDGDHGARGDAEPVGQRLHVVDDALVGGAIPLDEVHLVGADDELVDTEEGGDADVSPRLLAQAGGGVDQDEREVGRRGPGGHVAGVLDVARAVGDDELAMRRGGVAIGHVDGDALLALGPQAVGDEGEVDFAQAAVLARRLDGGQLVVEELTGVEEQPADQRALAVVHRSDGGEPEEIHGVRAELGAAGRRRAGQGGHGSRSTPRACGPPSPSPRSGRRPWWPRARRCANRRPRG